MNTTFTLWLAIFVTFVIVACDKPAPADPASSPDSAQPRTTKFSRPPQNALPTAPSNPREALENAAALPTAEERDEALTAVIENAQAPDMEIARKAFEQLTTGSAHRNRMISHLAMRLAEADPAEAIRWAESLAPDQEQSLAFGNIALVLSADDPQAAAKMLSDSGVFGRDFDVAVVQVVQRWAAQSPADAAAWVVQFDPGEARGAALQAIASTWLAQDRHATFAWIQGIQDTVIRDEALTGAAESILTLPESKHAGVLQGAGPEILQRFEKLKAAANGG